jgi:hypothetical protein
MCSELFGRGSSGKFNRSTVASQTGLPGNGGEQGRTVHREVVVKRLRLNEISSIFQNFSRNVEY